MSKNLLIIVLIIFLCDVSFAQKIKENESVWNKADKIVVSGGQEIEIFNETKNSAITFFLRNVHNSQSLAISKDQIEAYVFDESGKVISKNATWSDIPSYTFQGQESEYNLNLYLFPSRVYSPSQKRFFQPDPKSQYASPYLYVGSDPVNYIDYNGKEGKRLFLYGEEFVDDKLVFYNGLHDQMSLFQRDVYYVPLSDFLNEKPLCIPDWNGEVHIDAHMLRDDTYNVEVARSPNTKPLSGKYLVGGNAEVYETEEAGAKFYSSLVDGQLIGHRLRKLSIQKRKPVKSIFAAGCEGGDVAKKIGQGYVGGFEDRGGHVLQTFGLKEDYLSCPVGKLSSETPTAEGLRELKFYMFKKDQAENRYFNYGRNKKTGAVRFKSFEVRGAEGGREEAAYVDQKGLQSLAKGEITREAEPFLDVYKVAY